MRLYGKRFLGNAVNASIQQAAETRDAVLINVLPSQRLAQVQIQGSTELVAAFYPNNWQSAPAWLKPGNSVRITHKGGIRGNIELTGDGQVVPTVSGAPVAPVLPTAPDAVLDGLQIMPLPQP